MNHTLLAAITVGLLEVPSSVLAQPTDTVPLASPEIVQRWQGLRFGLFVHWGPVALTGHEIGWSRGGPRRGHHPDHGTQTPVEIYDNLFKEFNPVQFDAREWVTLAQDAGMKYLVFTTKHHDGFCNFDSTLTDYKITHPDSPYGKDITAQIARACQEAGLALGWYYSPPDWHHPDYRNGEQHNRYIQYMHGQIRELLTRYGPVDIFWFDGLGGSSQDWDSPPLHRMIRTLQPGIIINNRGGLPADYDTPEQRIGGFNRDRPWETCMTICEQWSWKPNDRLKSRQQCLQTLLRVVGGDGNLLFNVGPMPDGRIEPRQVERLREMGDWLKRYGQGVYGTRGGPFRPGSWGASTCRDRRIHLFVMNWPATGPLTLPPISPRITAFRALSGGQVTVRQTPNAIEISLPEADRDDVASVILLELEGQAFDIDPLRVDASGSLAVDKPARASNVYRNQSGYGAGKAFDDDPETRWATDQGTTEAWLEVDLGRIATCARTRLREAYPGRIQSFQLQCRKLPTQDWQTFHTGQTVGDDAQIKFAPLAGRYFRLHITKATDGPTLWEFQLFPPQP